MIVRNEFSSQTVTSVRVFEYYILQVQTCVTCAYEIIILISELYINRLELESVVTVD